LDLLLDGAYFACNLDAFALTKESENAVVLGATGERQQRGKAGYA
jgi:hypothetical protein